VDTNEEAEAGINVDGEAWLEWPGVEQRVKELKAYARIAGLGADAIARLESFQHDPWMKHVAKNTPQSSAVSYL